MTSLGFPNKFNKDISGLIAEYIIEKPLKLRDWINVNKLNWNCLTMNKNSIDFLEKIKIS